MKRRKIKKHTIKMATPYTTKKATRSNTILTCKALTSAFMRNGS